MLSTNKSSWRFVKFAVALLLGFCVLFVSACQRRPLPPPWMSPYHPLNDYQRSLLTRMDAAGVKVVKQGDLLKIIIPVDRFFRLRTREVQDNKRHALLLVARFVNSYAGQYMHPIIVVAGYLDTTMPRRLRKRWSYDYACVVARFLYHVGIASGRIIVRGYGAQYPIASNMYPAGTAFNRRVEITINYTP